MTSKGDSSSGPRKQGQTSKRPPGFPARALAAEALRRTINERRTIDEAMSLCHQPREPMSDADRGLARAILTVAFRRMGTIRAAIATRLQTGEMPDAGILSAALTIGVAQILFMDVPDHAAVDLSVEIAKADQLARHYAPLANALLRRIAKDKTAILEAATGHADTPVWLFERWSAAYGEDQARAISAVHGTLPHVDLTAFGDPQALQASVGGALLPNGSLRLSTSEAIPSLAGFSEGQFQVQDVAASLPARLIPITTGMRVLDLCAAPGGKTAQIAALGAKVIAVERSSDRALRLRENLARLRLDVEIVIGDAGTYASEPFDAVLLDAPCSATGTIRRHPEVAWTKTLADILALARQQSRLLAHAASLVKPGGTLVYATCSLEPEEGEHQIERFLASHSQFECIPIMHGWLGIPDASIDRNGILRILPSHFSEFGGSDGFFAARLQRRVGSA